MVVFDKTGTLTKGVFEVVEVNAQIDYTDDEYKKQVYYTWV